MPLIAVLCWVAWFIPSQAHASIASTTMMAAHNVISGVIFEDGDGDGLTGGLFHRYLAGVEVRLEVPCGGPTRLYVVAYSDEDGHYQFRNVSPGCYRLHIINPVGYTTITPGIREVRAARGDYAIQRDFALAQPGLVAGIVFADDNSNGIQDETESGLAGVAVHLYEDANANQTLDDADVLLKTILTDAREGAFAFPEHLPGRYILKVTPPDGFSATTSATQSFLLITGEGSGQLIYTFGLHRSFASIAR